MVQYGVMATLFKEKRSFILHPISAPLKLHIPTEKEPVSSEALDLSLGGLSFLWRNQLLRGETINLSILIKEKAFSINARVVFSKEDRKTGKYKTGVCFMDRPSAFKAKIAEEALEIIEYRKNLSKEMGRNISEEEAAKKWIRQFAAQFPTEEHGNK